MAYIDVRRVRGKMAEKEYTISQLAEKLGINRNTLSTYLETPEKMPYHIVSSMAEILCDSSEEANSIFFATSLRTT